MMIGVTLSLGAILVAWAGQSYGAFGGGSQLYYQQRGQALQENFVIEEVSFTKSSSQIFVFVRNVGLIDMNVTAIYINGTAPSTISPSLPNHLGVESVVEFTITTSVWGSSTTSGDILIFVVASARGNQVASTWRAP
jgi:archaellum component FlaF (FlaF/FlaG flagellin family)